MMERVKGKSGRLLACGVLLTWASMLLTSSSALSRGSSNDGNWAVSIGQAAPPFELRDTSGRVWRLAQFAGKPVVLFFWGSW